MKRDFEASTVCLFSSFNNSTRIAVPVLLQTEDDWIDWLFDGLIHPSWRNSNRTAVIYI